MHLSCVLDKSASTIRFCLTFLSGGCRSVHTVSYVENRENLKTVCVQKHMHRYYPEELQCIDSATATTLKATTNKQEIKAATKKFQKALNKLANETLCGIVIATDVKVCTEVNAPPGAHSRWRVADTGGRSGQVRARVAVRGKEIHTTAHVCEGSDTSAASLGAKYIKSL